MATIDEHVKIMMLKGESGSSIKSIDKTATSGLTDTYTITLTNGDKQNFTVTNGKDGEKGDGVGTLKLGGRNLYTRTRDFSGDNWINKASWTNEDETYNGFTVRSCSAKWNGIYQLVDAKSGESFVLSGYFKAEAGSSITAFFSNDQSTTSPNYKSIARQSDDVTSWTRFSVKFDKLVDGMIAARIENDVDGKKLCVCGLKLERGNNATDWTPAPEDKADVSTIVPKASVESSTTASQAYAAGDYVVVNGVLRKVKSAIAKGNTISDSNSTATTVAGELATLGESVSRESFEHNGVRAERFGKVVTLTIATPSISITDSWGAAYVCALPWQPTGEVVFAVTPQGGASGVIGRVEKDGGLLIVGKDTEWRSGWLFGSASYVCA